jgi:hypothetical protein
MVLKEGEYGELQGFDDMISSVREVDARGAEESQVTHEASNFFFPHQPVHGSGHDLPARGDDGRQPNCSSAAQNSCKA